MVKKNSKRVSRRITKDNGNSNSNKKTKIKNKKVMSKDKKPQSRRVSRLKPRCISARLHPNSKRNYQKVRCVSPHMVKKYVVGKELSKVDIDQLGGGLMSMIESIRNLFDRKLRKRKREIKKALKEAKGIRETEPKMKEVSNDYARSIITYSTQIDQALDLANEYINRFREKTVFLIISKYHKDNPDIPTPLDSFYKGGRKREAINRMKVVRAEMKGLQSQLISLHKQITAQRKDLKKVQDGYEKAVSAYVDSINKFAGVASETYNKYLTEQNTVQTFRARMDEPAFKEDKKNLKAMKKAIKQYEKIEKGVIELMKKNKSYRQKPVEILEMMDEKKNEVRYLDKQFVNITKLKQEFINKQSKKYESAMEDLFKMLMEITTTGKTKIKKHLSEAMEQLENVHDKLYQEKRDNLRNYMKTVEQFRSDINSNLRLEKQIQKAASGTIEKFYKHEPAQSFKLDLVEMISARNTLRDNISLLKEDVIILENCLKMIQKNKKDTAIEYIKESIASGHDKLPSRIKGTGAETKISYTQQPGDHNKPNQNQGGNKNQNQGGNKNQNQGGNKNQNQGGNKNQNQGGKKKHFRGGQDGGGLSQDSLKKMDELIKQLVDSCTEVYGNKNVYTRLTGIDKVNEKTISYTMEKCIRNQTYKFTIDGKHEIAPKLSYQRYYDAHLTEKLHDTSDQMKFKWTAKGDDKTFTTTLSDHSTTYKSDIYYNNIYHKLNLLEDARNLDFTIFLPRSKPLLVHMLTANNSRLNKLNKQVEMVVCPFTDKPIIPNSLYYLETNISGNRTGQFINMITGLSLNPETGNYDENMLKNTFNFDDNLVNDILNSTNSNNMSLFGKINDVESKKYGVFTDYNIEDILLGHGKIGDDEIPLANRPLNFAQGSNVFYGSNKYSFEMLACSNHKILSKMNCYNNLDYIPNGYLTHLASTQKNTNKTSQTLKEFLYNIIFKNKDVEYNYKSSDIPKLYDIGVMDNWKNMRDNIVRPIELGPHNIFEKYATNKTHYHHIQKFFSNSLGDIWANNSANSQYADMLHENNAMNGYLGFSHVQPNFDIITRQKVTFAHQSKQILGTMSGLTNYANHLRIKKYEREKDVYGYILDIIKSAPNVPDSEMFYTLADYANYINKLYEDVELNIKSINSIDILESICWKHIKSLRVNGGDVSHDKKEELFKISRIVLLLHTPLYTKKILYLKHLMGRGQNYNNISANVIASNMIGDVNITNPTREVIKDANDFINSLPPLEKTKYMVRIINALCCSESHGATPYANPFGGKMHNANYSSAIITSPIHFDALPDLYENHKIPIMYDYSNDNNIYNVSFKDRGQELRDKFNDKGPSGPYYKLSTLNNQPIYMPDVINTEFPLLSVIKDINKVIPNPNTEYINDVLNNIGLTNVKGTDLMASTTDYPEYKSSMNKVMLSHYRKYDINFNFYDAGLTPDNNFLSKLYSIHNENQNIFSKFSDIDNKALEEKANTYCNEINRLFIELYGYDQTNQPDNNLNVVKSMFLGQRCVSFPNLEPGLNNNSFDLTNPKTSSALPHENMSGDLIKDEIYKDLLHTFLLTLVELDTSNHAKVHKNYVKDNEEHKIRLYKDLYKALFGRYMDTSPDKDFRRYFIDRDNKLNRNIFKNDDTNIRPETKDYNLIWSMYYMFGRWEALLTEMNSNNINEIDSDVAKKYYYDREENYMYDVIQPGHHDRGFQYAPSDNINNYGLPAIYSGSVNNTNNMFSDNWLNAIANKDFNHTSVGNTYVGDTDIRNKLETRTIGKQFHVSQLTFPYVVWSVITANYQRTLMWKKNYCQYSNYSANDGTQLEVDDTHSHLDIRYRIDHLFKKYGNYPKYDVHFLKDANYSQLFGYGHLTLDAHRTPTKWTPYHYYENALQMEDEDDNANQGYIQGLYKTYFTTALVFHRLVLPGTSPASKLYKWVNEMKEKFEKLFFIRFAQLCKNVNMEINNGFQRVASLGLKKNGMDKNFAKILKDNHLSDAKKTISLPLYVYNLRFQYQRSGQHLTGFERLGYNNLLRYKTKYVDVTTVNHQLHNLVFDENQPLPVGIEVSQNKGNDDESIWSQYYFSYNLYDKKKNEDYRVHISGISTDENTGEYPTGRPGVFDSMDHLLPVVPDVNIDKITTSSNLQLALVSDNDAHKYNGTATSYNIGRVCMMNILPNIYLKNNLDDNHERQFKFSLILHSTPTLDKKVQPQRQKTPNANTYYKTGMTNKADNNVHSLYPNDDNPHMRLWMQESYAGHNNFERMRSLRISQLVYDNLLKGSLYEMTLEDSNESIKQKNTRTLVLGTKKLGLHGTKHIFEEDHTDLNDIGLYGDINGTDSNKNYIYPVDRTKCLKIYCHKYHLKIYAEHTKISPYELTKTGNKSYNIYDEIFRDLFAPEYQFNFTTAMMSMFVPYVAKTNDRFKTYIDKLKDGKIINNPDNDQEYPIVYKLDEINGEQTMDLSVLDKVNYKGLNSENHHDFIHYKLKDIHNSTDKIKEFFPILTDEHTTRKKSIVKHSRNNNLVKNSRKIETYIQLYSDLKSNHNELTKMNKLLNIHGWKGYSSNMNYIYCDINMKPIIIKHSSPDVQIQPVEFDETTAYYNYLNTTLKFNEAERTKVAQAKLNGIVGIKLNKNGNPIVNRKYIKLENPLGFDTYMSPDNFDYESVNSHYRAYPRSKKNIRYDLGDEGTYKFYHVDKRNPYYHDLLEGPTLLDCHYYYLCRNYYFHFVLPVDIIAEYKTVITNPTQKSVTIKRDFETLMGIINMDYYIDIRGEINKIPQHVQSELGLDKILRLMPFQYAFGTIKIINFLINILVNHKTDVIQFRQIAEDNMRLERQAEPEEMGVQSGGTGKETNKEYVGLDTDIGTLISFHGKLTDMVKESITKDLSHDDIKNKLSAAGRPLAMKVLNKLYDNIPYKNTDEGQDKDMSHTVAENIARATTDNTNPGIWRSMTVRHAKIPEKILDSAPAIFEKGDYEDLKQINRIAQMVSTIVKTPLAYEDILQGAQVTLPILENVKQSMVKADTEILKSLKSSSTYNQTVELAAKLESEIDKIQKTNDDPKLKNVNLDDNVDFRYEGTLQRTKSTEELMKMTDDVHRARSDLTNFGKYTVGDPSIKPHQELSRVTPGTVEQVRSAQLSPGKPSQQKTILEQTIQSIDGYDKGKEGKFKGTLKTVLTSPNKSIFDISNDPDMINFLNNRAGVDHIKSIKGEFNKGKQQDKDKKLAHLKSMVQEIKNIISDDGLKKNYDDVVELIESEVKSSGSGTGNSGGKNLDLSKLTKPEKTKFNKLKSEFCKLQKQTPKKNMDGVKYKELRALCNKANIKINDLC